MSTITKMKLYIISVILIILALGMSTTALRPRADTAMKIFNKLVNMESELELLKAVNGELQNNIKELQTGKAVQDEDIKNLHLTIDSLMASDHKQYDPVEIKYDHYVNEQHAIQKPQDDGPRVAFVCPLTNASECIEKLYGNQYDCSKYWSCSNVDSCNPTGISCAYPLEFSEEQGTCIEDSECIAITTAAPLMTTAVPYMTTEEPYMTTDDPFLCPPPSCYEKIAFFARTTNHTGVGTPVLYDNVPLNLGNAYNPATGRFTAPLTGIYSLSYVLLADASCFQKYIAAYMYLNGGLTLLDVHGLVDATASGTIVTLLAAGEYVTISLQAECGVLLSHESNTFAGHLLYTV